MCLWYLFPQHPQTISLVYYFASRLLLSISQLLLDIDKDCTVLVTTQEQKKKILSPIFQLGQLEENLGILATFYYSVGDDRMGASGSSPDFFMYQIFLQSSCPHGASD